MQKKKMKNKIFINILILSIIIISLTTTGVYAYFLYDEQYDSIGGNSYLTKASIEYGPSHNITFIIDSKLNNVSPNNNTSFSAFTGYLSDNKYYDRIDTNYARVGKNQYSQYLENTTSDKIYIYRAVYLEPVSKPTTFGMKFEIANTKTTGDIRNIILPTFNDITSGVYEKKYAFSNDYFSNIQTDQGGSKPDTCLIVREELNGDVFVIIRIVTEYHQ